jgi:RNA polymerase sigma factor (sigma-70 family)
VPNTESQPVLSPVEPATPAPASVATLLSAFVARRDERAFAELVRRNGAMVLGVCRRVTGNPHDADDAFQATFLVLARKAHKIRPPEQLGAWLYGVAYRTALKARTVASRRREGERRVAVMNSLNDLSTPAADDDPRWADLRPVLDEELSRLPDRYRAAIVACDLEGKSRQDAAAGLAINEGTLSSRLSRGREMLAARLTRRGVALSAGAVAALVTTNAATTAPAAALVTNTATAAVSLVTGGTVAAGAVSAKAAVLSEGVLRAMFVSKAKIVASLVLGAALTGTGVAVVTQIALADKTPKPARPDAAGGKFAKADYVQPDVAGVVTEVSADAKSVTIRTGKGNKTEPPASAKIEVTPATEITFSSIGPGGDAAAIGYHAQVWLEPNSNARAARIAYNGQQSIKDNRPVGVSGKISAVSADGKQITVASRAAEKAGKGEKGAKGEKGDKGVAAPDKNAKPAKGDASPAPDKGHKGEKATDTTPVEVTLSPQTQVTFSAVGPDGATFREGYDVQVIYDPKAPSAAAAAVRVQGAEGAAIKGLSAAGPADLVGNVVAVAPGAKSVTLECRPEPRDVDKAAARVKVEDPPQRVDVPIAAATKVIYNAVPLNGATPTVGYHATVWLEGTAAKTVLFDAAAGKEKKGPDYSGPVLSVSPDGKRITVTSTPKNKGDQPEEIEIFITEAKVIFNNVHAGEAKPMEGQQVQVWTDPAAPRIATIVVFGPGKK